MMPLIMSLQIIDYAKKGYGKKYCTTDRMFDYESINNTVIIDTLQGCGVFLRFDCDCRTDDL